MKIRSKNKSGLDLAIVEKSIISFKSEIVKTIQKHYSWDRHEAQTIYHDACLLVLQQIKDGTVEEINKAYLIKVCKNLGANQYRKSLKEKKRFSRYWVETSKTYQETIHKNYGITLFEPEEYLEIYALKALRAFSLLDKKCQQIIQLKYVSGHSHKTIADHSLHINTADSAKTTLNRCLKYWRNLNNRMAS